MLDSKPRNSRFNMQTILGFLLGVVASLLWMCGAGSIAAVVMGFMGRKQIRESGGRETGDGLALAGIIIGFVGVVGLVLWVMLVVIGVATSDNALRVVG